MIFLRKPFVLCAIVACIGNFANSSNANQDLPGQDYYNAFPEFYAADYQDALRRFVRGANGAFKIGPNDRFMDSVCYWTMAGECLFHMGNYADALAYYEQAIALTTNYANGTWQERLQPKPLQTIRRSTSAVQKARITWYQTNRGGDNVAVIPSFGILFGRVDAARAIVEGGPIQNPEVRKVDHAEIMRCIALAIYRRYTIRGIASHIDPNTAKIIGDLGQLPTQTPIFGQWNLVVRGLAKMSGGRNAQAAQDLQAALKLGNQLDHGLTPIALLALSKIAFQEGNADLAGKMALEASYSAAIFAQHDLVEEALSFGNLVHLSKSKSVYAPLPLAIEWAAFNRRARRTQTSLLLGLADDYIESNNVVQAGKTLNQVKRSMSGTDLGRTKLTGQFNYLNAALAFLQNKDGYPDLRRALEQLQQTSLWLFRLHLVNSSLAAGSVTQRQAELMYERLLIDPVSIHWAIDPMETMAYTTSAHVGAMEAWFEIVAGRKNHEKAIEIAERIRRHRFYESLPLAGRLVAIRWMLTAPADLLSPNSIAQRQAFFRDYPKFAESLEQIANIETKLKTLPLKPADDSPEHRQQRDLFVELLKLSKFQESLIQSVALKRQAADFVFPMPIDFSGLSKGLKAHQVLITSLQTAGGFHQYAITQNSRRYLGVVRERDMRRSVGKLYKAMGIADANSAIVSNILTGSEWKTAAAELKKLIFENYHDDQWENHQELIVVPDGLLWYVPFEILQIGDNEADWVNLNEKIKIRYLPMASMVVNSKRRSTADTRIAVVTGKMHLKGELELTERGFEDLKDSIQNVSRFNRQVKIPSNLTNTVTDTMMVWHDMKIDTKAGAFGLTPFFLDRGKDGSTLGSWLRSPWGGCERIILPSFSSMSAGGIKSRSTGKDLFLTTCGMLASGSRSLLISRWRPGGENSVDISREYLIRSQETSSIEALESSVKMAREQDLNLENEIRVKPSRQLDGTFKAEHPFFWAGNMLVDLNGYSPPIDDANDDPTADATPDGKDLDDQANDNPANDDGDKTEAHSDDKGSGTKQDTKPIEVENSGPAKKDSSGDATKVPPPAEKKSDEGSGTRIPG